MLFNAKFPGVQGNGGSQSRSLFWLPNFLTSLFNDCWLVITVIKSVDQLFITDRLRPGKGKISVQPDTLIMHTIF